MEPWTIALIGIGVFVALFIPLFRRSSRAASESHKRYVEKWQELYKAIAEAHIALNKKQVTDAKVFEMLIDAAQHLGPDHTWVSTQRIISSADYYRRAIAGLELVSQARAKAGV